MAIVIFVATTDAEADAAATAATTTTTGATAAANFLSPIHTIVAKRPGKVVHRSTKPTEGPLDIGARYYGL